MFFDQPKTVASVLATFQKTIDDLNEIQNREQNNVNRISQEITTLEAERANSEQEKSAAMIVADKISKLISA